MISLVLFISVIIVEWAFYSHPGFSKRTSGWVTAAAVVGLLSSFVAGHYLPEKWEKTGEVAIAPHPDLSYRKVFVTLRYETQGERVEYYPAAEEGGFLPFVRLKDERFVIKEEERADGIMEIYRSRFAEDWWGDFVPPVWGKTAYKFHVPKGSVKREFGYWPKPPATKKC